MKLHKEFFHYVIPSMLAFALSGVYAIADGFFVGNALGDSALAAVNIAYPLTAFLQAVGTGIGMGGAIQYAISAGTENPKRGRQYFGMSLITVSYTHLDVYKRQLLYCLDCCCKEIPSIPSKHAFVSCFIIKSRYDPFPLE